MVKLMIYKMILLGNCAGLQEIDYLTTDTLFPIQSGTVVTVKCDHPWFTLSGNEQITCVQDWTYNFEEKPSCSIGETLR